MGNHGSTYWFVSTSSQYSDPLTIPKETVNIVAARQYTNFLKQADDLLSNKLKRSSVSKTPSLGIVSGRVVDIFYL